LNKYILNKIREEDQIENKDH